MMNYEEYGNFSPSDLAGTKHYNIRNERIKQFLRYSESSDFFKHDSEEEMLETKNSWACFAYVMLLEKVNDVPVSERDEKFFKAYFSNYLLSTYCVGLENKLKNIYLKYLVSEYFEYDSNKEVAFDQFITVIRAFLDKMHDKKMNIVLDNDTWTTYMSKVLYNTNTHQISISNRYIEEMFDKYIREGRDSKIIFEVLNKINTSIENAELEDVRKNEISPRAVVYTIEEYLGAKSKQGTKLGKMYGELYVDIIANKQIYIDSYKNALEKLKSLGEELFEDEQDNPFYDYLKEAEDTISNIKHYYNDAKYFDTNDLENDATSKLLNLYIKGIKAMPKKYLTNVTKCFVVNGRPLSVVEMDEINSKNLTNIGKQKGEEKTRQASRHYIYVDKVTRFIEEHDYSYVLENKVKDLVLDCKDIDGFFIRDVIEHYDSFEAMKDRVLKACNHIENLASSGSKSKVESMLAKYKLLNRMVDKILDIEVATTEYINVDTNKDVVILDSMDKNKTVALLQEFTGRGVVDSGFCLNNSIDNGEPVLRNLSPGFKEFIDNVLIKCGSCTIKKI